MNRFILLCDDPDDYYDCVTPFPFESVFTKSEIESQVRQFYAAVQVMEVRKDKKKRQKLDLGNSGLIVSWGEIEREGNDEAFLECLLTMDEWFETYNAGRAI